MQSLATNEEGSYDLKLVEVEDPVRHIIAADGGAQVKVIQAALVAYPDICALQCGNSWCGWADWEAACGDGTYATVECGRYITATVNGAFLRNPEVRGPYARHLGGVNLGFLDGHAAWMHSEAVLVALREDDLTGAKSWGITSDCTSDWFSGTFVDNYPDDPPTIY